ncbi:hypothetical protein SAY86_006239 [Trapa natans]|uniref:Uncharacterized protein n=1 Tax=Trapa natans TaxID=22666 RepID=A0AAN7QVS6_TRANT|nr:hypothetical protein SAY86_006239 [Trapa natans]
MGGGGVIRTVGKVVGIGAAASRSFRGVPLADQSARGASLNVASIVTSKSISASTSDVAAVSVQRPAWEIDGWEFAGEEGDPVITSGEPLPRVVFGPTPTFEEARAATDELKDALEKVYLSSPAASDSGILTPLGHQSDCPLLSDSEVESKRVFFRESVIAAAAPAPKHAVQAFKLLSQSSAAQVPSGTSSYLSYSSCMHARHTNLLCYAQNAVASIASDPNVWDAVLKNEALMDFLQARKSTAVEFPPDDSDTKNFVENGTPQDVISVNSFDNSAAETRSGGEDMSSKVSGLFQHVKHAVEEAVEGVKHAVEEMVSKVSGLFQHIFGRKEDDNYTDGGKEDGTGTTLGQSFLGLAMLAIMVILLRRA